MKENIDYIITTKGESVRRFKAGDKIRFLDRGITLQGELDNGGSFFDINHVKQCTYQHCCVYLDEVSKSKVNYIGSYLAIDLEKEIKLCDDGYYIVQIKQYNKGEKEC